MIRGFMFRRVLILVGVLLFGLALPSVVHPYSDLINVFDVLTFFLASYVLIIVWEPAVRIFTDLPIKFSRLLSLGIGFLAVAFVLFVVNSITWRAFGVTATSEDTFLRYAFRYLFVVGLLCIVAAPEFFEQTISFRKIGRLGAMLVAVAATVLLLLYGSRLELPHDTAPTTIHDEDP